MKLTGGKNWYSQAHPKPDTNSNYSIHFTTADIRNMDI